MTSVEELEQSVSEWTFDEGLVGAAVAATVLAATTMAAVVTLAAAAMVMTTSKNGQN
jgi:hypothetical protein